MRVKIVDWAVIKINFQAHYSGKNFFIRSNFLPRYIRPQKYPNDDDLGMSNCDSVNGSKLLTANLIFFSKDAVISFLARSCRDKVSFFPLRGGLCPKKAAVIHFCNFFFPDLFDQELLRR